MKKIAIIPLMLIVVGCSNKEPKCEECISTVYPVLKSVDVNLSDVPVFRPDVKAIEGTDRVSLPTNDLLSIKDSVQTLRGQKVILKSVVEFQNNQVKKFNEEFVNGQK